MQFLAYILVYPILYLVASLPFRLLYILSDFIYILVYYIIGYRKKVVRYNLQLALPHLSEKERKIIEKKSYKHLCDMFMEMLKTMKITQKQIEERFVYKNLEIYKKLEKEGKSIALVCAHYASYEWVISLNRLSDHEGVAIYKKINNKYFDKLVREIRFKFGATLIHNKESIAIIQENFEKNKLCTYGFASDQSPQLKKLTHWGMFLNHELPIHTGAEYLAKKYDMNVIYLRVNKVKRGFYEAEFEILCDKNIEKVPNYEITETFLRRVEEQIYNAPEFYMWTHKRFKHLGKKTI